MANSILNIIGTQLVFADHIADFSPAAAVDLRQGSPTTVQLALAGVTGVAATPGARQSAKFDLGATFAPVYSVTAAFELAATPTAGNAIEVFVAPSPDPTAANGNPGGTSGSDAAYTGYSSNIDASVKQLDQIGSFIVTTQVTTIVQIAFVGLYVPKHRYGCLIVVNRSGASFHTDDVDTHIVFDPIIPQVQ